MTSQRTQCCITGAGPAGLLLGHLLARAGIDVTVLEARRDFAGEFRGDAIYAWTMELMQQLGLAERLLALPHRTVRGFTYQTARGPQLVTDYSVLSSPFPFVTALPQARLLEYLAAESAKYPGFHLELGATVTDLVTEGGRVAGVRYTQDGGDAWTIEATLTVGADGRSSRLRRLGGFAVTEPFSPQFDVLWFRVPRAAADGDDLNQRSLFGRGFYVSFIDRVDHWQVAYTIPKGSFAALRARGLPAFRQSIADLWPAMADRLQTVDDWSKVKLLPVRMNYARRWYRPGLLLIGDAAHVMSSIGGVGILCGMQDAVQAANMLVEPLRRGVVRNADLARVQRRRALPTRVMQLLQFLAERQYVSRALDPSRAFDVPMLFRLPGVRRLIAYVTAYGPWPVRLRVGPLAPAGTPPSA